MHDLIYDQIAIISSILCWPPSKEDKQKLVLNEMLNFQMVADQRYRQMVFMYLIKCLVLSMVNRLSPIHLIMKSSLISRLIFGVKKKTN